MDDQLRDRINAVIKVKKIKLNELATLWGLKDETIKNYFREPTEERKPTPFKNNQVVLFAGKYKIDLNWLQTGTGKNPFAESENLQSQEVDVLEGGRPPSEPYKAENLEMFAPIVRKFTDGTYKLFTVEGNSMMHSINQGDWLYCKKDDVKNIVNGRVYALILTNQKMAEYRHSGRWVKRCYLREKGYVSCKSDYLDSTEPYITFHINVDEIAECWYPVLKITGHMADPNKDLYDRLDMLEERIELLETLNQ